MLNIAACHVRSPREKRFLSRSRVVVISIRTPGRLSRYPKRPDGNPELAAVRGYTSDAETTSDGSVMAVGVIDSAQPEAVAEAPSKPRYSM